MKSHASGSIVRKCATTVASAISTSDTTIAVTDATGIVAGDEIVIEANTTTSDLTDEHPEKYTVSSVSGNNVTILIWHCLSGRYEHYCVCCEANQRLSCCK